MVKTPTRGSNILDLLFSANDSHVTNVEVGEPLGTSDHNCIRFEIELELKKSINGDKVPNFRLANFDGLRESMASANITLGHDVNQSLNNFLDPLKNNELQHIPRKNRRPAVNQPKYWKGELQHLQSQKKAKHSTKQKHPHDDAAKQAFVISRRILKKVLKRKRKDYENEIAANAKTNPKQFFSYISSKKNSRSVIGPLENDRGVLETDDTKMSVLLNQYFCSVFTSENQDIPIPQDIIAERQIEALSTVNFSPAEVIKYIDKLKVTKSPGPDQIHPRILKETKNEIAEHLSNIFTQSLENGACPSQWKEANVTPIFKKGDKKCPGNYRPISLTSVIGKLMESLITDKITEFLETNKLIGDSQHGFRHNRSCLTNQ